MGKLRWTGAALCMLLLCHQSLSAQENATVSGRVTNASGAPEAAVAVRIMELNVGTTTVQDGSYRLVVPGSRLPAARQVTISASRQGLSTSSRSIMMAAGANMMQNFALGSSAIILDAVTADTPKAPAVKPKPKPKSKPKPDN